jgi:hypothetical protein
MRSSRFALALLASAAFAAAPAWAADPVPAPGESGVAPGTYTGPDMSPTQSPPRRPAPAPAAPDQAGSNVVTPPPGGVPQRSDKEVPHRGRPTFEPQTPGAPPPPRPVSSFSGTQTHVTRTQSVPPAPPPRSASPTQVEELVRRSNDNVDFFELVDDMIDEIARRLALEDANLYSPMAIRLVRVSANLRPEFAHTLEARLTARLLNATSLKLNVCAECTALRSRVDNGNWILTLGASNQDDLRRLGERTGIRTFMDVDFTFSPDQNIIWLEATVLRASDGMILWSDAYRSDGTMTSLLRTGQKVPTRAERSAELEQKMAGRPSYGYAASLGMAQLGYTAPTGDVVGAQAALRFHERFGENQNNLFGISAGIFTTGPPSMNKQPQALNSILLGAYYSHDLSAPNLNKPEFWIYGEGGGMFTGNEGNTFYLESGVDVHLKFRLSLQGGLMYVFPTTYSGYDLGGLGFRVRVALNW